MVSNVDTTYAALLVDQAPDAIILADREGLIRAWNADIIIPESLRDAHWKAYHRALAAGVDDSRAIRP